MELNRWNPVFAQSSLDWAVHILTNFPICLLRITKPTYLISQIFEKKFEHVLIQVKYSYTREQSQIGTVQDFVYIGASSPTEGQAANQLPELTANDTCHKVHI